MVKIETECVYKAVARMAVDLKFKDFSTTKLREVCIRHRGPNNGVYTNRVLEEVCENPEGMLNVTNLIINPEDSQIHKKSRVVAKNIRFLLRQNHSLLLKVGSKGDGGPGHLEYFKPQDLENRWRQRRLKILSYNSTVAGAEIISITKGGYDNCHFT